MNFPLQIQVIIVDFAVWHWIKRELNKYGCANSE